MAELDEALTGWADGGGWLLALAPSQSGKSTAVDQAVLRLLAQPGRQVCVATYSAEAAELVGYRLRTQATEVGADVSSRLTTVAVGFPVPHPQDALIVDDLTRNWELAQSRTVRDRIWAWWHHEALPVLAPDGRAAVVETQWHPDDLGGRLIATEPERWKLVDLR